MDFSIGSYCCVSCGASADELSHHYKEGVIKIIHCVGDDRTISFDFYFGIFLETMSKSC